MQQRRQGTELTYVRVLTKQERRRYGSQGQGSRCAQVGRRLANALASLERVYRSLNRKWFSWWYVVYWDFFFSSDMAEFRPYTKLLPHKLAGRAQGGCIYIFIFIYTHTHAHAGAQVGKPHLSSACMRKCVGHMASVTRPRLPEFHLHTAWTYWISCDLVTKPTNKQKYAILTHCNILDGLSFKLV